MGIFFEKIDFLKNPDKLPMGQNENLKVVSERLLSQIYADSFPNRNSNFFDFFSIVI